MPGAVESQGETAMAANDTCTGKHSEHICELAEAGKMAEIKNLTREVNFLCGKCGRAAELADNLCFPEDLRLIGDAILKTCV
jgi:bacterioferritin-associated ferredoxin